MFFSCQVWQNTELVLPSIPIANTLHSSDALLFLVSATQLYGVWKHFSLWRCGLIWSLGQSDTQSQATELPNTSQPTAEMMDVMVLSQAEGLLTISGGIMYYVTCFFPLYFRDQNSFLPKSLIPLGFVLLSLRGNVETSSVWLSHGTGPTCMCAEQARTTPYAPTWTEDAGHR